MGFQRVETMEVLPEEFERIAARLETLERRVSALEHPAAELPQPLFESSAQPPAPSTELPTLSIAGGTLPVLGRVMLGIAGAYLLRAIAESSSSPRLLIAVVAIAYAVLWLVWATRLPAGAWFASTTYACTSALILAPMLWELTLVFKVFPAAVTAGVLGAYACTASALAWKRNLASVFWIPTVTAAFVALALVAAARDMLPFLLALLLMAVLCEYAVDHKHGLGTRPWVAAAADLGILAMIYLYSSPASTHAEYKEIGPILFLIFGCLPLLIYGASAAVRTVVRGLSLGFFEVVQTTAVFLLAAISLLCFGSSAGAVLLAVSCLLLSLGSYAATYLFVDPASERRNYHVFAAWSAALFLVGNWLLLAGPELAAVLAVAAILATLLGTRLRHREFRYHGVLYLSVAAILSELPAYCWNALVGSLPTAPPWVLYVVLACAAACYGLERREQEESWHRYLLPVVAASLALAATASILVFALVRLTAFEIAPEAQHIALIRTLIASTAAIALASTGASWRRAELIHIAYATLALLAVKLLLEDLRHGHLAFIAASIFLFAVALISVPRLARSQGSV